MISQLLFGDYFTILEKENDWCLVEIALDQYQGYVHIHQIQQLSELEFNSPAKFDVSSFSELNSNSESC